MSASRAKALLERCAACGIGHRRAGTLAGIAWLTVYRIRHGLTTRIHPDTEAAILGMRPSLAKGCAVAAYDAKRLLLSVLKEGYSETELAERLGLAPATVTRHAVRIALEDHDRVTSVMRVSTVVKLRAFWAQVNEASEGA